MVRLQGGPLCEGYYPHVCAVVRGLSLELPPARRQPSIAASARSRSARGWMKPTSAYAGNGGISIVRWIRHGQTINFLLTEQRDERAALRFLTKAIRCHNVPEKITIDGSEAHAAAIRTYNQEHGTTMTMRQVKYLNNVVEQDHRSVKRVTRPMLGFKSFDAAQSTLIGIELMHMLRKGQLEDEVAQDLTPAEQFYALAA